MFGRGTGVRDEGGAIGDAPTAAASVAAMRASLVKRAFLPSPLEELPGPQRTDAFARLRALFTLSAVLLDVAIYVLFRDSHVFNPRTLVAFFWINVPLLAGSFLLAWFVLRRRGRWHTPLSLLSIAIECFTSVVWIQVTGSVSSYFMMVVPVLILSYRLYNTYQLGLAVYVIAAVMHVGVIGLEEAGVLRAAPLFAETPGGIYSAAGFRIAAAASIQLMFLAVFILANVVARALREKETELAVAERNLDRAVAEVSPGRLSGKTLGGKYRLGELLGRGGMGEVYQAERIEGRAPVAVKVLYAHLCGPDDLERFRREATIAAKLPAAHVAQVFDVGASEDGHNYLVMELLRGEDLGTLLRRRGQLPPDELLEIVEPLVVALEAAHGLGIVHRDLKPQNVFLATTADGIRVKLLDFGVARLVEGSDLTQSSMLIGSPGYLAPEQVATEFGAVGPQADVFALGTMIYRALTGQSAFPARTPAAAVYEAVHREPPPPSQLAPALAIDVDCVLALALAKQPAQRYATPSELVRDLREACAGALGDDSRRRGKALAVRTSSAALAPTLSVSN